MAHIILPRIFLKSLLIKIPIVFTYTLEKFLEEMSYLADALLCDIHYSINREIVKTREERTTARAETEKANINVNVAVRDQFIYGELCKTMPCQWMQKSENEQAILVMEQVRRASRENNRSASLGPHATLTRECAARSPTTVRRF